MFLEALRSGSSITKAAKAAGVGRATAFQKKAADEEFAKAWDDAYESGTDTLEDEAVRRARDGVSRPVFQGGLHVGDVQEYSDTLMNIMLQGRRPTQYRKASVELTGPDGGPVTVRAEIEFIEAPKQGAKK